jgi:hypothetical protein
MAKKVNLRPDREPTDIEWAQLAAYIDGEGCILIDRRPNKKHPEWAPNYLVSVIVSNSDPRLIVWSKQTFGGFITNQKDPRIRKTSKRVLYGWRTSTRDSRWVLEHCLPYLIIKREQAEIALAMFDTFADKKYSRWNPMPDEVRARRDSLVVSIREMKKTVPTLEQIRA